MEDDEIDLSACELTSFPAKELLEVTKGAKVDASVNHLSFLPDSIGSLKHLTSLDLSKNHIQELPNSIGQLSNLKRLDLFGNEIRTLPLSFRHLKQLQFLDLKNNPLDKELADVAGSCVDEKECRDCAKRVLRYLKEKASEEERLRQKQLEKKREADRLRAAEEERAQNELRQRKKEEKQRRREEHQRLQEEKERQSKQQEQDSEEEEEQSEEEEDATGSTDRHDGRRKSGKCICCLALMMAMLGTILIVATILISQCPAGSRQCPKLVKFLRDTGIYRLFPYSED